ncbi:sensor histidine kinase [Pontibacterium sp.]|uniref:sensor histidine kinase n=2 Tax=Pontibacterium sp. TaxID=2036026 RepID=UPI003517BCC4
MIGYLQKSLPGRVIGLLILVFGLVNAATVYIFFEERGRAVRWTHMEDLVARSASMGRLLDETPQELHAQILESVSTERFQFAIQPVAAVDVNNIAEREHPLFTQLLAKTPSPSDQVNLSISPRYYWCYSWIKNLLQPRFSFNKQDGRRPLAIVSIRRGDQGWLNGVLMSKSAFPGWLIAVLVALCLFTLTVVAVVLIVRHVTRPLEVLTDASEQFGRGETFDLLPEQGPEDVRRTTRAFNRMRDRLERYVVSRTQMLAAISHDLRTPLTSLRLQAEFIDDVKTRAKILDTVSEMQEMTEATLAFTREDASKEDDRTIDLAALIESLCEDLGDIGLEVECQELARIPYTCRPGAIKRALTNVIENACNYGGCATVAVVQSDNELEIKVTDQGPGIPEADRERVFDPFVRLETSRNRNTGGIGLGLSITRTVAHAHGGDVLLRNLEPQGLEVTVSLPR